MGTRPLASLVFIMVDPIPSFLGQPLKYGANRKLTAVLMSLSELVADVIRQVTAGTITPQEPNAVLSLSPKKRGPFHIDVYADRLAIRLSHEKIQGRPNLAGDIAPTDDRILRIPCRSRRPRDSGKSCCSMAHREKRFNRSGRNDGSLVSAIARGRR